MKAVRLVMRKLAWIWHLRCMPMVSFQCWSFGARWPCQWHGRNMALTLQQKCEMRDHTEVLIECCSYGVFFLMNSYWRVKRLRTSFPSGELFQNRLNLVSGYWKLSNRMRRGFKKVWPKRCQPFQNYKETELSCADPAPHASQSSTIDQLKTKEMCRALAPKDLN